MRGYVELVADPRDRCARIVRFTSRGLELRQAGLEAKRSLWAVVSGAIGNDAAAELARHLHRVADALALPARPAASSLISIKT